MKQTITTGTYIPYENVKAISKILSDMDFFNENTKSSSFQCDMIGVAHLYLYMIDFKSLY